MATLATIAVRVHDLQAMVAFYSEAFGARFEDMRLPGIQAMSGTLGALELKFVLLRDEADFEGFPLHQLGFEVAEIDTVLAIAQRHGGRLHGEVVGPAGRRHGVVRDPDGNTIELYAPA